MSKRRKVAGLPDFKLRLDWRAYFRSFCEQHGEPLEIGGRLVFPDGWSYSASDHKGPEWPPPEDQKELRSLLVDYWTARKAEAVRQFKTVKVLVTEFSSLQAVKSAPLMRKVRTTGEDGKAKDGAAPLDQEELMIRLEALASEIERCDNEIQTNEVSYVGPNPGQPANG